MFDGFPNNSLFFANISVGNPYAARAMSEAEIANMLLAQAPSMADASWATMSAQLQNYRPPVHVPQGFADWYSFGDELH